MEYKLELLLLTIPVMPARPVRRVFFKVMIYYFDQATQMKKIIAALILSALLCSCIRKEVSENKKVNYNTVNSLYKYVKTYPDSIKSGIYYFKDTCVLIEVHW